VALATVGTGGSREAEFADGGALPPMSDEDFAGLRKLVHEVSGIALADSKRVMLASRLATRLRQLKLAGFPDYRALLATPGGLAGEQQALINAVTTNKTGFFRESHHFDFIGATLVPAFVERARTTGKKEIVIWSAACSTGQEPWTIAMTLMEKLPDPASWTVRLLATDIDSEVLRRAESALYSGTELEGLSPERLTRHLDLGKGGAAPQYRIKDALRRWVTFRQLNFIDDRWPIKSSFDFAMCRNASIYFDAPTQQRLFNRLCDQLVPQGYLFVGHAEVLHWMGARMDASPGGVYHRRADDPGSQGGTASALRRDVQSPGPSAPPPTVRVAPAASAPTPRRVPPPAASSPAGAHRAARPPGSVRGTATSFAPARASSPPASRGGRFGPVDDALALVNINVGETHVSREPVEIKTLLGSCVAACMYDPVAGVGGMNHFLLPHTESTHEIDRQRFGTHAMETLINGLMSQGADRHRLQAKIFGGGNVLGMVTKRPTVGEQNAAFATEFLRVEGIALVASRLGGSSGMEVRFHPHTGKVFVRDISRDLIDLSREEAEDMPMVGGDAELFT
jgi:chemotaxis protein methyltransferase CheR